MGAPADFNIELLVIRVGDWGDYMMADCDDPVPTQVLLHAPGLRL